MVKIDSFDTRPLISICVPVLNEENSIIPLIERLDLLKTRLSVLYDFEYIFTDNNSTDATWEVIQKLRVTHPEIRAYRFGKNIGFQKSILFNYKQAKGEAVIQVDADLQDPPELIETFLDFWKQGFKVVSGVRTAREESMAINMIRKIGYWFINVSSEHPIKRNTGDFRLIDRAVVDALSGIKSPNPYLRGVISGMRLTEKDVHYKRDARKNDESKFGAKELLKLGLTGFSNHSKLPIKIANFVGFLSLALSIIGFVYFIALKYYQPNLPRGFASLYIMILFGIGVNSILLGVVGSYIRKIYDVMSGEDPIIVTRMIE